MKTFRLERFFYFYKIDDKQRIIVAFFECGLCLKVIFY